MLGGHLSSSTKNWTTCRWPCFAAAWSGRLFQMFLWFILQCFFRLRNFTISKCPLNAARWSSVCLFSFEQDGSNPCSSIKYFIMCRWPCSTALRSWRIVGLHFRSVMKDLSISKWPWCTATWMGVLPTEFLDVGSHFFSKVRNFTTSKCPLYVAQRSGVFLYLSKHDGSHFCSSIRYLITCRWPCSAA